MADREQIQGAIAALEAQRAILGDAVVETALAPLREKLAALEAASHPAEAEQRRQVSVLFADVSGFTAMSETLDAEEVRTTMNALWTRLDKALQDNGGHIDKHIGDAVMALFGTPVVREDDPERAIRAALSLQSELAAFNEQARLATPLRMRVGINTGPVLLGTVGTTGEFTAMGDAVNLASRLEHAAPVGGILISHDTYRHVRGLFHVLPQEPIAVKGKVEPIQTYIVQGLRPRAFRVPTRGVEGIETRTIGREAELQQLQAAFQAARRDGRTHLANIVAEAGTGKSRLLYEFQNWLDLLPETTRLFKGRASQEMQSLPYALVRDVFAYRFEIQDGDRASAARDKLERGILEFMGPDSQEQAHFIGHLIGFDFSASPHLQGILTDSRQIRDRALHYTAQFFASAARESAAVVMLEDIHWADDSSLDLFEHVLNAQPDLSLMVVAPTRPTLFERRPNWGAGPMNHLRLDLAPLSADTCRQLVAEILQKLPAIPPLLQDLIVTRAEGSPFYVEELIKMLIDDHIIRVGGERWEVDVERLAGLRIPQTLTAVVQARLDGLPAPERHALQQAAVVGRVFWSRVVERLREASAAGGTQREPVEQLRDDLNALCGKELIFRREGSAFDATQEFIFKHAILHDVTYESVLMRLRRAYHAQVAESLMELGGERVGEYAGRIGEHFERAGDLAHAAEWYGRAGRQAQASYALEAAADYYRRALKFWRESGDPKQTQSAEWMNVCGGLGEVLTWQAQFAEAIEIFTEMRRAAEAVGDQPRLARAWYWISQAQGYHGEHRTALESAARAEAVAQTAGARTELAMALSMRCLSLFRLGEAEAAQTLAEQMLHIAGQVEAQGLVAHSLSLLGALHNLAGRYRLAEESFAKALDLSNTLGDRGREMSTLNNLGVIAEARGDYRAALDRYQEALEIARGIGHRQGELVYLTNRGAARVALGEFVEAEADLVEVLRATEAVGSGELSGTFRYLAEAYLGQGKLDEARTAARRALTEARSADEQELMAAAWRTLGRVAGRTTGSVEVPGADDTLDEHTAAACFAESLRICKDVGMEGEAAWTLRAWADFELRSGDRERGLAMWKEARDLFERLGVELEVQRMARMPVNDAT